MKNCKYCKKQLQKKKYPAGAIESDERFVARMFCNPQCYYKGTIYETARDTYKVLKKEREDFINRSLNIKAH